MPLLLDEQHPFARCLAEIPLRLQLDENRVARTVLETLHTSGDFHKWGYPKMDGL